MAITNNLWAFGIQDKASRVFDGIDAHIRLLWCLKDGLSWTPLNKGTSHKESQPGLRQTQHHPPQDGISHKEYLKVLYAEDRPRLFCLNLWLILWNVSLYMIFLCGQNFSPKGEHKRGRAKGLTGKRVKQSGHPQVHHSKCKGSN